MKTEIIKNIVSGVPMIVALLSLVLGWCNSEKISNNEKQFRAFQYQPRLKPLGSPRIVSAIHESHPFVNNLKKILTDPDSIIPEIHVPGTLIINGQVSLLNSGNALARIRGFALTDTNSFEPVIRQLLTGSNQFFNNNIDEIEMLIEVLPGDTVTQDFSIKIAFFDSNRFILHLIVLYENEFENLYDTYTWNKYLAKDIAYQVKMDPKDSTKLLIMSQRKKVPDLVIPDGECIDAYYSYSIDEASRIRTMMDALMSRKFEKK